jgi:putative salt-induced outer membrane protein YdiY
MLNPKRKKIIADKILVLISLATCLAVGVLPTSEASAAEVFTKDQGLEGSVVGVTAEGVEFETIYGKGTIAEADTVVGRIWGLEDGRLLVGESFETAAYIPVEQILRSITRQQYDTSRLDRLRVRYRYWTANFDLAFGFTDATTDTTSLSTALELRRKKKPFGFTDATTDTTSLSTALELRRKKKPFDFFFGGYFFFRTSKESGESRVTNENRLLGRARLDRDLSERTFAFGQLTAEYDEIQDLSLRTDPVVGIGYRFVNSEKLMISGRSGPGYVYQRYFGGEVEDYFTILFGADLEAELPYGSKLRWGAEYLPEVSDWQGNYLIRTFADWTMPIIGWLDFKIAVFDTYNNRPPDDTERNTFTTFRYLQQSSARRHRAQYVYHYSRNFVSVLIKSPTLAALSPSSSAGIRHLNKI